MVEDIISHVRFKYSSKYSIVEFFVKQGVVDKEKWIFLISVDFKVVFRYNFIDRIDLDCYSDFQRFRFDVMN